VVRPTYNATAQNRDLHRNLATALFDAIRESPDLLGPRKPIPGLVDFEIVRGTQGPHAATMKVVYDHGGDRGKRIHMFTVSVSEMTR